MSGEVFTIRRKVFTLTGASFHLYKEDGSLLGFSRQKAFKLKEDIRIYRDEAQTKEKIRIQARSIIDFSAAYDIYDSTTEEKLGSMKRKGFKSMFRDTWTMMDEDENEIAKIQEESSWLAFLRRFVDLASLIPQKFVLSDSIGDEFATFKTHFNPFVHKMTITIEEDSPFSPLMILSAGLLLMAIEGRQT